MPKHRSPEEWSRILAAYRNRTGSQANFCAKHKISTAALHYHLKKSRGAAAWRSAPPPGELPRIIELVPDSPLGSLTCGDAVQPAAVELSWESRALGTVTVRCHHRQLGEIITQIAGIDPETGRQS